MKSSIFLIFGFTQFIFCSQLSNITDDENNSMCPATLFRRKRANADYTRWRSNAGTTPEFIVKVLDDDVATTNTNQVIAVNILPVTKRGEKIIVGGAMVPAASVMPSSDLSREYTRFVPPTTVPVTHVEGEIYIAPIPRLSNDAIPPIKPKVIVKNKPYGVRHMQRDESPPASPQFVAHSPGPIARQFAPIAAVSFTRRATNMPLTPPYSERVKTIALPTRTTTEFAMPMRTISEDFPIFQPFRDEEINQQEIYITRTSEQHYPERSTTERTYITFKNDDDDHELLYTKKSFSIESRRVENDPLLSEQSDNKINEKDSDIYHNIFLYNEDYKESSIKKLDKGSNDIYEDKDKDHEENDDTFAKNPERIDNTSPDEMYEGDSTTDNKFSHTEDELSDESDKLTSKLIHKGGSSTVAIEKSTKEKSERPKRRQPCNLLKLRQLNFNSPRTLPEIVAQLKQWAEDSPVARWVDITDGNFTTMENPIYMMIVDDPSSGQIVSAKQTVMIVAGIQGRDHHAVAAAMYLLYQLIERSEAHTDLLTKYRFWVIPVFNPDGYDYSMTFPHRREWTKNLRQNWDLCKARESCRMCATFGLRCTIQPCYGVNLDRNFEYQWIPTEELRTEHPCGSLYAGTRQLSEAETRALTHFLHNQRSPLFTFIAYKEGDVLGVMYPYSHTRKRRAFDHVYRQRASRAASAAYSISGRPYVAGQTSEFLPLYAGGIEDWVDGHLGIDNTYTIMMFRPTDSYNSKLITERVVHEAYAAMDTLLLQSVEPLGPPVITHVARTTSDGTTLLPDYITMFALATLLCS